MMTPAALLALAVSAFAVSAPPPDKLQPENFDKNADASAGTAGEGKPAPDMEVKAERSKHGKLVSVGGVGSSMGKPDAKTKGGSAAGGGSSGGGGGRGGGGGSSTPTPSVPPMPKTPPGDNVNLVVECGANANVLRWVFLDGANSNSILKSVDGGTAAWACGGPNSIPPCTNMSVTTWRDTNVQPGKVYRYTHKSAPSKPSNAVYCPPSAAPQP